MTGKARLTIPIVIKIPLLCIFVPILGTGCSTYQVQSDIPCPPRPILESITPVEQLSIDPQVLQKIVDNQLRLKSYSKKLEARAVCDQQI